MAVLADVDRFDTWGDIMRQMPGSVTISKVDLRAVINATDQWVSDNATAFNTALPLPGRTSLNAAQKAFIFALVLEKRYLKGV